MKDVKYRKLTLQEGEIMFVRDADWKNLLKSIRNKNPKEMAIQSFNVMLNSPEGITKLSKATQAMFVIMDNQTKKGTLKAMRDMIDYRLNLKKKAQKPTTPKKDGYNYCFKKDSYGKSLLDEEKRIDKLYEKETQKAVNRRNPS